ncbi:MAG TPA: AAA family ATPase, partial [Marinilabiliaceae bacterium]|nr:AAA family ATPase [Marinilabiliaceae bacterium]
MIIDEVSISNFQCYYGRLADNFFKFNEGLNLIIADNAGGKSKLFDAFYWLLNDQVYVTEQARFVSTGIYKERLINVRSLEERGLGVVPVEVEMKVRDSNNDSYKITRRVNFMEDDGVWEIQTNKLIVEKLSPSLVWSPITGEKEIESILGRVMPGHLKPYMWFQGEALSNLLDFRESKALKAIIDKLSDVSDYDDLVDLVGDDRDGLFARASDELRKAQKKSTSDQTQVEALQTELSKIKKRIKIIGSEEYTDTELGLVVSNLATSSREMEELLADLDAAEELIEARKKKEILEEKLRSIRAQEAAA